jgi:hypothetical protein
MRYTVGRVTIENSSSSLAADLLQPSSCVLREPDTHDLYICRMEGRSYLEMLLHPFARNATGIR